MADQFGFVPDDDKTQGNAFGFELSPEEQEKVAAYTKSQEPSEGESALVGAQSGLTFDFDDELGGAMGAGMEGFINAGKQGRLPYNNELESLYGEYRDMHRKRKEQAQQAHPGYYTAGAVGGGALVPAGAFGKLGKLGAEAAFAEKAAKGIGMGAVAGGLQGAGASEAPVMSGEFARDVGTGSAGGAAVGGLVPAAAGTAKFVYETAKDVAQPMTTAFSQGMRQINLLGTAAEPAIQQKANQYGLDLTGEIHEGLNKLGETKNQIIQEASENGMKADPVKIDGWIQSKMGDDAKANLPEISREMEEFREILRTAKEGPLVDKDTRVFYGDSKSQLGKFEDLFVQKQMENVLAPGSASPIPLEVIYEKTDVPNKVMGVIRQKSFDVDGNFIGYKKVAGKLMDVDEAARFKDITEEVRAGGRDLSDPSELLQLYKALKQRSQYGDSSFGTAEARQAAGRAAGEVQDLLHGSNPRLKETDAKIAALKRGAAELGYEDTVAMNDETKRKMRKTISMLINQQGELGPTGSEARTKLKTFANIIRSEFPDMAKEVEKNITDLGEQTRSARTVAGLTEPGMLSTGKRVLVGGANQAGRAVGGIKSGVYSLSKMAPESLQGIAQQVSSSGGKAAQELGKILSQLPDKTERERNAILFGLMQNPAYRQFLDKYSQNEDEAK